MKAARHSILLLAAFTLAACGDDDNTGPENGSSASFEASVTGAVNASLNGSAGFGTGTNPQTGQSGFALALTATGGTIVFFRVQPGTPAAGTLSIGDDVTGQSQFVAAYIHGTNQFFVSSSGSLTITSSSSTRLRGNFSFDAVGTSAGGEPVLITVSGTFDAVGQGNL